MNSSQAAPSSIQPVDFTQPLALDGMAVKPDHIDANGHMNVGYYNVIFDQALDELLRPLGLDWSYMERTNFSTFALETHVCYLQEVVEGDVLRFTFRLLDCDAKRVHCFLEMHHAEKGYLAATSEQVLMNIDMATRRSAPFPPEYQALLARLKEGHDRLPRPPQAGRSIGLARK
ncbi:thioesterase family protein [Ferrovibrio sp.]|uniref:thioesterase family protein n=1 Tax=Ferrovibrio sp. TaxID=1917215 RepID=UPI00351655B5